LTHLRYLGTWIKDTAVALPSSVTLTGIDVSSRLWDRALETSYPNITFLEGTAISLPPEWTDTFALVQQRLLLPCLKRDEWPVAIAEIHRVLRPGGWVQFTEHVEYVGGPCTKKMETEYYRKLYDEKNGLWSTVGPQLPTLLRDAGFDECHVVERPLPIGSWGGKVGEMTRKNLSDVLRAFIPQAAQKGFVEQEVEKLIQEAEAEWDSSECTESMNTYIARKP
jgi:SAM-dependent methyltransferase